MKQNNDRKQIKWLLESEDNAVPEGRQNLAHPFKGGDRINKTPSKSRRDDRTPTVHPIPNVLFSCALYLAAFLLLTLLAAPAPAQTAQPQDALTSAPQAAEPAVTGAGPYGVDISVGYATYQADLKMGVWYPVWAMVEARKADLEGEIVIQQPRNQLAVTIPLQVAKGSRKRYLSYYQFDSPGNPELEVTVRLKKIKGEGFKQPLRFAEDSEQHILALADEPGSMAALNRQGIDAAQIPTDEAQAQRPKTITPRRPRTGFETIGGTKVIYGSPELLPEEPIALDGIDGIIISTARVRALNKRQWDALGAWVARGGRLLLAGGKNQPFIEQSVARGAFGIALNPAQPSPMAEVFGAGASESLLASWPAGGWTRIALGDAKHPLITGRPVGRGWFYACAVALDAETLKLIASRADAGRLWPELLERHQQETPLELCAQNSAQLIGADLQRPFSVNLAGTGWVLGFLGIYIMLVLPVNWFICGRLKRREWAWPAAIAIALAFTWYGYSSGLRSQSSVFQVNEITFVTHPAGAAQARGVTFSAVFSPRRYRTELKAGGGVFANRPNRGNQNQYNYYYDQGDLYSDRNLEFVFSPSSVWMGDFFFHPWSARNLRSDFTMAMSGGVETAAPMVVAENREAPPVGEIVNRSPWRFKRWWISDGAYVWKGREPLARLTTASLKRDLLPSASRVQDVVMGTGNIVHTAIEQGIIQPAMKGSPNPNRNQGNSPADPWRVGNSRAAAGQELFFIGEADVAEAISPMLEKLKLEKRVGVILYEAALAVAEPEAKGKQQPLRWTPMMLNRQAMNDPSQGYNYNYRSLNPYDAGSQQLIIRTESTNVQLAPNRPVKDGLDGPLTFALHVENYPNKELGFIADEDRKALLKQGPNRELDQITGKPMNWQPAPDKDGKNPPEYLIAGCPVLVYNVRKARMETTRILEDGRHTVSPARDYLDPGSSALLLRVDAEIPLLVFQEKQGAARTRDAARTLNAKEIFGGQTETISLNNYYGHGGQNQFSFQVKLKDISVTLGDATTTSTLERRAQ